jgi:parvulin-like peptidyl-prolyl isomerase
MVKAVLVVVVVSTLGACDKKAPQRQSGSGDLPATSAGAEKYQESVYNPSADPRHRGGRADRVPARRPKRGPLRAGAHILVAYQGSAARKPDISRSKPEARALATKLTEQLKKDPSRFAALAKKHSDGPTGRRGGLLGVWPRGRMVPAFDKAIDKLEVHGITGPVETKFGFHVIKRLDTQYAGRHILVSYQGAARAKPDVTRTKAEALAEAKRLAAQARKSPEKFAELAKKHSDGPSGPRGGSLGVWKPGRMVPAFQTAVEGLKVGGITAEPVETRFGFHVIKREDPKDMGK